VKLLLDCHELLWALLAAQKLSPGLRNALEDSDNRLLVSFIVIRVFCMHTSAESCCRLKLGSHG
jgi:PIN domain nuclease of toxin-antitoxin system